jgi:hypothetical protein
MSQQTKAAGPGKLGGWIVFVATLLVLSFAAMPGHQAFSAVADRLLIAVRLSLVLALSVLVVRERLTGRAEASGGLLQRCRRWFYDE